ncbi:MAG: DUF3106 domain-containing protein [Candidatus Binatia bacterium]|nr:DUF3106 domain-containing protein [Candidatus Binatia bacterium]
MTIRWFGALLAAFPLVLGAPVAPAEDVIPIQGWDQLSPGDREKAQEKYDIYKNMPKDRQQEIQRSYQEWQAMRPGEKDTIRKNYKAYRDLTPEQRRAVGQLYQEKRYGD